MTLTTGLAIAMSLLFAAAVFAVGMLARAFARVMSEANAKTAELEREVMEHRRTEAARDHYAARERLFSAAVESSTDAVVTASLDRTITGWNPAPNACSDIPRRKR